MAGTLSVSLVVPTPILMPMPIANCWAAAIDATPSAGGLVEARMPSRARAVALNQPFLATMCTRASFSGPGSQKTTLPEHSRYRASAFLPLHAGVDHISGAWAAPTRSCQESQKVAVPA